jgi:hypothetical protein
LLRKRVINPKCIKNSRGSKARLVMEKIYKICAYKALNKWSQLFLYILIKNKASLVALALCSLNGNKKAVGILKQGQWGTVSKNILFETISD